MGSSSSSRSGRGQQQAAQRHPAALAARERGHVLVAGRHAQGVHGHVQLALQVPGVAGGRSPPAARRTPPERSPSRRAPSRRACAPISSKRRSRPTWLGDALLDVAAHVLGGVQVGLLRQQADRGPGRQHGVAGEVAVEPGHDPQQGRLARAVRAQDADLGARHERQRDVVEHHLVRRVDPPEAIHGEDVLVRHVTPSRRGRVRRSLPFVAEGGSVRPGKSPRTVVARRNPTSHGCSSRVALSSKATPDEKKRGGAAHPRGGDEDDDH